MNSNSTSGCSVTLAAPCLSVLFLICEMKVVVSSTPGLSNLNKALFVKHLTQCLGEGNGTPLQYSCLENPMDGGAWWATVHGVAKSWTRCDFTHSLTPYKMPHTLSMECFSLNKSTSYLSLCLSMNSFYNKISRS